MRRLGDGDLVEPDDLLVRVFDLGPVVVVM